MQPILTVVVSAVGLAIALWIIHSALRSTFRSRGQKLLGVALIAAGIGLLSFRVFAIAVPLLIIGTGLLLPRNAVSGQGPSTGTSRVRSAHLEMTLDHATGNIDGRILAGKRQGQFLSDLELNELLQFRTEVRSDEDSVRLLETFIDSNHLGWRDETDEDTSRDGSSSPDLRQLSRDEAYQLLGLEAGASEEDIREAYHRLIKLVHPDRGGSAALAAQITEARDRLLGDRQ